jgi:hypothetical protein
VYEMLLWHLTSDQRESPVVEGDALREELGADAVPVARGGV